MIRRHLSPLILEALGEFPAVAILGSRQVGKSTLAQDLPSADWPARYVTLDDFAAFDAARRDPGGFVWGLELPAILDEVQRAPEVLLAVKRVVDRDREPGRFLLTGSANLMTMRSVSETLAGRVALFELHPFSWSELEGTGPPSAALDALFSCRTAKEILEGLPSRRPPSRAELLERVLAGGYPVPALMRPGRVRSRWFESYRQTYLERDLREIASVARLPDFGRLLVAAAANTGRLLNTAELSRDLGVPINTVRRHLGLLETTYQVWTLQPYSANVRKRLVKTPKLYFGDTGLACHLLAVEDPEGLERRGLAGAMVETWVASELRKAVGLSARRTEVFFWRTHGGREVDFILARGTRLAGVEVRWAERVKGSDLAGIESCREDTKGRLGLSVILHSGDEALALNDRVAAVPMSSFFA